MVMSGLAARRIAFRDLDGDDRSEVELVGAFTLLACWFCVLLVARETLSIPSLNL